MSLLDPNKHYTVAGYEGIAFYYVGDEMETYWEYYGDENEDGDTDYYEEECEAPTGMVLMVMVGDDRKHSIDPEDVTELPEDAFCRSCGQIGCGHNVYE
jgi:hypothetical protein